MFNWILETLGSVLYAKIPKKYFNFKSLKVYWVMLMHAKWLQLCLTLHDPMDCSPPGSSDHGILQARILEWVAISSRLPCHLCQGIFPTQGSNPCLLCLLHFRRILYPLNHLGSPLFHHLNWKMYMDWGIKQRPKYSELFDYWFWVLAVSIAFSLILTPFSSFQYLF